MLVEWLVSLGYRYERLRNSFKKFCGRYQDLIVKSQRSVSDIGTHYLMIPNSNGLSSFDFFFNLDLSLGLSTHLNCG